MANSKNYIFASLLVGVYDVNRNELLQHDDFEMVRKWYNSIIKLKLNALIFHNTFSETTTKLYENEYVKFIKVDYDKAFNPNVYRYFIYQDFISKHLPLIANLFVTDITDVELIQNPFISDFYLQNTDKLFCGDENKILNNEWMNNHNTHLRNSIPTFAKFEHENQHKTLLNCGIIGGNVGIMQTLLDAIVLTHKIYSIYNNTPFTMDMGVFNYIARTKFDDVLLHGEPINTVFKKYETHRTDCWFIHK